MPITAIEGIVENGNIRLHENISLPENTKVYVIVPESTSGSSLRVRTPRLAHPGQAKDFHKQIIEVSGNANL